MLEEELRTGRRESGTAGPVPKGMTKTEAEPTQKARDLRIKEKKAAKQRRHRKNK